MSENASNFTNDTCSRKQDMVPEFKLLIRVMGRLIKIAGSKLSFFKGRVIAICYESRNYRALATCLRRTVSLV